MKMTKPIDKIVQIIKSSKRILLAAHVNPDADALGSQLALGEILVSMGKEVCLYSEEPASHMLDFLPGCQKLERLPDNLDRFDSAIALDCGDQYRLGKAKDALLAVHPFLVIDHHAGNREFGDLLWVDSGRSATAEMVFELAQALDVKISPSVAYCLYAAIVADTGSFKYSSTTEDTFHVVGELVGMGVNPAEVAGYLFDNFSLNRLRLLQEVLNTLEMYADEQIAVIFVTAEMYERTGTSSVDTELLINYPRSLQTVKAAVFIKEADDGLISVSLRSKGDCDVARVAAKFGGGGHRNAAGFKKQAVCIEQIRDMLMDELKSIV